MTVRRMTLLLLMTALARPATAETVTWEAVTLNGSGGRQVVAKGVKTYSPAKDIVVQEQKGARDGVVSWSKSLLLDGTFAISANVHRERRVDGFGLVVSRRGDQNGFSWEWFDRERGAAFQKRQDSGRVSITIKSGPDYEELESITFLDDTTLRYLDDMSKPPGTHTHEVVVRKGSVLRVAP
jgi:hypothetical protein